MFELRPPLLAVLTPAVLALGCALSAEDGSIDSAVPALGSAHGARPPRTGDLLFRRELPDHGASVAVDPDDDSLIVAGHFDGTLDLGGGPMTSASGIDLFVARFARDGHPIWSRRYGGPARQTATAVAVDGAGDILVAATTQGDLDLGAATLSGPGLALAKLTPAGDPIWSRIFPGTGSIRQIRTGPAGGVVLRGWFSGGPLNLGGPDLDDGGGASSTFVAKLDADGRHVWSKGYGDKDLQAALGVDVDGAGNVVVVGRLAESFDFGGGALTSAGELDAFVVKYGPSGDYLAGYNFGDDSNQIATSVTVDRDDNIVLIGYNYGTIDFNRYTLVNDGPRDMFLAKLGPDGRHAWSKGFDGGNADLVASDAAGNILLAGAFRGTIHLGRRPLESAGDADVYLAKFGPGGRLLSARRYGGPGAQYPESLAVDAAGHAAMAGAFAGSLDLGDGPRTSPSSTGQAGFVARIVP
jgi:hypothetical protein